MDERFLPDAAQAGHPAAGAEQVLELADRLGPDQTRSLISAVVRDLLADDQREVWRRRRERFLHFLNVVEYNLDYDLRVRGLGGEDAR
jgi:hypothetical protein